MLKKNCKTCDKIFLKKSNISLKNWNMKVAFCSRKCWGIFLRELNKSKLVNGKRVLSEETHKKMSTGKSGKNHHFYGKSPSPEHRKKLSEALRGEKSPYWQGGITKLYGQIRRSFLYRQWRLNVFRRDCFTCVECGDDRGGNLNADHFPKALAEIIRDLNIKSFSEAEACDLLWDINNGRTLCVDCHKLTATFGGKFARSFRKQI